MMMLMLMVIVMLMVIHIRTMPSSNTCYSRLLLLLSTPYTTPVTYAIGLKASILGGSPWRSDLVEMTAHANRI